MSNINPLPQSPIPEAQEIMLSFLYLESLVFLSAVLVRSLIPRILNILKTPSPSFSPPVPVLTNFFIKFAVF